MNDAPKPKHEPKLRWCRPTPDKFVVLLLAVEGFLLLEHLKGLAQLRELRLNGTPVTNKGLVHLKKLIQLQRLGLDCTQVTDEGVEKLQQALPNGMIGHRPPEPKR